MTHRGPFQPLTFCDFVNLGSSPVKEHKYTLLELENTEDLFLILIKMLSIRFPSQLRSFCLRFTKII